jgi:hypothetical protein
MKTIDLLREALTIISKENAWTQSELMNNDGQVCAIGSLMVAGKVRGIFDAETRDDMELHNMAINRAVKVLGQCVDEKWLVEQLTDCDDESVILTREARFSSVYGIPMAEIIIEYNDDVDVTQDDIINMFSRAIELLELQAETKNKSSSKVNLALETKSSLPQAITSDTENAGQTFSLSELSSDPEGN